MERDGQSRRTDQTADDQSWWLGFLDTGAHDVVFADAPGVRLYAARPPVLPIAVRNHPTRLDPANRVLAGGRVEPWLTLAARQQWRRE